MKRPLELSIKNWVEESATPVFRNPSSAPSCFGKGDICKTCEGFTPNIYQGGLGMWYSWLRECQPK
jgi:hypothetical protein